MERPRANIRRYVARRVAERSRYKVAKEIERRQLLEEAVKIRGSLRLDKWLIPGLTFGGIATIIGGVALAAVDMREAGIVVAAGGGLSGAAACGRSIWSVAKGNTAESLDSVQKRLQIRHRIMPDKGYFDRAHAASMRAMVERNRTAAGEDAYETNPFGVKSLKSRYRY